MASLAEKILAIGRTNPVEQAGSLAQRILGAVPQTGALKAPAQTPVFPTPASAVPLWQKIIGGQQGETFLQTYKRVGAENTAATKAAFDPNASPELRKKGQDIYAGMTFGFTGTLQNVAKKGAVKGIQALKGSVDDLTSQARKYKTAEEFVKSQGETIYHGTAGKFETFDEKMKGSVTGAKSAHGATWFTDDPAVAKAYSVYAAETGPVNRLMLEADRVEKIAQKSGKESDWLKYDKITQELEKLDTYDANFERRKLANVKEVVAKGDFYKVDAKGKTPQELSSDGDIDSWLNVQVEKAKKLGKDGIVIKNIDDAVGLYDKPSTHYAIFDTSKIKTRSQLTDIWNKAHNK